MSKNCLAVLALICLSIGGIGCKEKSEENVTSTIDVRDKISQLESKLKKHPDQTSAAVYLSMLYAASVRLDEDLSDKERERRKKRCVSLVRVPLFSELDKEEPDKFDILYYAGILAQNYVAINKKKHALNMLSTLESRFQNKDFKSEISLLKIKVKDLAAKDWPCNVQNPWKQGGKMKFYKSRNHWENATQQ